VQSTLIHRTSEYVQGQRGTRKELEHVKPLDGLRGIAILLVIIPHLATAGMLPGPGWMQQLAESLAHGVDLFFVLSGFGLAYPFLVDRLASKPVRFDALTYAFNRVYRILPPYYVAIGFAFAIAFLIKKYGHVDTGELLIVPHTAYQLFAPLLLFDRGNLPINPNLWTIAVQLRWYLAFPLLLFIWMKSPRAFGILLGCAWLGYLFTRARSVDLGTLPLFMLGIVAAHIIVARPRWMRLAVVLLPVALVIAFAWDAHAMMPDPWDVEVHVVGQPTSLPWQVAALAMVLTAVALRPVRVALSWPPLVWLGTASFSLYLVHQPIIALTLAVFGTKAGAIAFAAVLAIGFTFWWFLERRLTGAAQRRRAREKALPVVRRVFAALGLPRLMVLARPGTGEPGTVMIE
jgi:exopolysaccharide production protein ExoZ